MRNFTFTGLSTSAVLLLALAGCHTDPPRLVDAGHVTPDTGIGNDAYMSVMPDTGPPVDTGVRPDTGGSTGMCTYGTGGCNLTSTSSCPPDMSGARQGCYPDMTAPGCHVAGTAVAGATCAALNDCDAGLVCLGTGVCAKLCCSASDCGTGEVCQPLADATGTPLPNHVGACHRATACTPVPASGCDATHTCTTTAADGSTDCVTIGTTAEGGDCSSENCAAGLGCFTTGSPPGPGTCYRFCRRAMGNVDCTNPAHPTCGAGLGTTYGLCM